ncbi:uncharacterized protein BP01DRAFT_355543 [Aspergillus saccharolyticus JOP 1030-1]|uniref:C2H2-type domain-containing protein n=1 Tax=Aspergillus saccharolyticus JOP 1030-1 TaxID=1450539 RepID=A0A319AIN8_9EURO|nr:hypothetical protein BP01DRAFT_355543 [Aspergillus saccharolyticus JOP 1030-1]PYH46532.1 hypothetical protein BP01DRAFT_355543 [Aspergillus saccharolyticus JOP 1030-1]
MPTTTSTSTAAPFKLKCICCKKTRFKTVAALHDHQRALNHHPVACPTCQKQFCDPHAVQQHQQAHQKASKTAAAASSAPATTDPQTTVTVTVTSKKTPAKQPSATPVNPPNLPQTTHQPSPLHPLEQDLLYKYLLARCHPPTRLQAQDYPTTLGDEDYRSTPLPNPAQPKCRAVVLTGDINPQTKTLTHLTATDFLSNEALLHLSIGPSAEQAATEPGTGTCSDRTSVAVSAYRAARDLLWSVIDAHTILVGHDLRQSLRGLQMVHGRVVDAGILTAEAVVLGRSMVPLERVWGLRVLCSEMLGWSDADAPGKKRGKGRKGRCEGWEGCVGVREVVVWCLRNPEMLRAWAEGKASIPEGETENTTGTATKKQKNKKKKKKKNKNKKRKQKQAPRSVTPEGLAPSDPEEPIEEDEDEDEGLEIIQWTDLE